MPPQVMATFPEHQPTHRARLRCPCGPAPRDQQRRAQRRAQKSEGPGAGAAHPHIIGHATGTPRPRRDSTPSFIWRIDSPGHRTHCPHIGMSECNVDKARADRVRASQPQRRPGGCRRSAVRPARHLSRDDAGGSSYGGDLISARECVRYMVQPGSSSSAVSHFSTTIH